MYPDKPMRNKFTRNLGHRIISACSLLFVVYAAIIIGIGAHMETYSRWQLALDTAFAISMIVAPDAVIASTPLYIFMPATTITVACMATILVELQPDLIAVPASEHGLLIVLMVHVLLHYVPVAYMLLVLLVHRQAISRRAASYCHVDYLASCLMASCISALYSILMHPVAAYNSQLPHFILTLLAVASLAAASMLVVAMIALSSKVCCTRSQATLGDPGVSYTP